MGELVSAGLVLLLLVAIGLRAFVLNRRAARLKKEQERLAAARREKEAAVMRQVQEIRARDDLGSAQAAVQRDPERAARVLRKMMRK